MEILTHACHNSTAKEQNEIEKFEVPATTEQALVKSKLVSLVKYDSKESRTDSLPS